MLRRLPSALLLLAFCAPSVLAQATLTGDTGSVALTGGTQSLLLDGGAAQAGDVYFLLGSRSGTQPGQTAGGVTLPLVLDGYFLFTLNTPNSALIPASLGTLDGAGRAAIEIVVPAGLDPALAGTVFAHAALILDPAAGLVDASNPVELVLGQSLSVDLPLANSTVGSATIDVSGSLSSAASGSPGVEVRVNGALSAVQPGAGPASPATYFLANVELDPGANTLLIEASAGGQLLESTAVSVQFDPLDANNVRTANGRAYAALGNAGLGVLDLETRTFTTIAPPAGAGSVDDLDLADGLLFALDAAGSGRLFTYDLSDPDAPLLINAPVSVPVSPFAGVAAAGGRVVVSGGTSLLTVRAYAADGTLGTAVASIDLGTGQPDVEISADGQFAWVSTDFAQPFPGASFGVTLIALNSPPQAPTVLQRTGIPGAGFTAGGSGPANFAIESAVLPTGVFTAHGAGLTSLDASTGILNGTLPLGFSGVSAAGIGSRVFVVGTSGGTPRLAEVDVSTSPATVVSNQALPGAGSFTGVAADVEYTVIAANGGGLRVLSR